ncbi:MAG: nucleoside 2-deoxyribosyltransferase domain-containing protein [Myxococcota bacterium]
MTAEAMTVVYAKEAMPRAVTASVFLAGPTPRSLDVPSWRPQCLELLEAQGFAGVVFVPEPRDGVFVGSYDEQIDWELQALARADCILFWVPRDLETMPAFTTNVEFGHYAHSGKVVLGAPADAPKLRYLRGLADRCGVEHSEALADTVSRVIAMVDPGAERHDGECQVPLHVWRTPSFQAWYSALRGAGNTLEAARAQWAFRVRDGQVVFFWALHVSVWVAAEGRRKSNEIVLSRPDVSAAVLVHKDPGDLRRSTIALVREFRSPAATTDGYVRENPGGSAPDFAGDAVAVAAEEVFEETGLRIEPHRLRPLGARQVGATVSAHRAHAFAVELTAEEMERFRTEAGVVHGDGEERTSVEVYTLGELLDRELTDWSTLGMILAALSEPGPRPGA